MKHTSLLSAMALSALMAAPALAQDSSPACDRTKAVAAQSGMGPETPSTSMAATSSGGGGGSGASSASIATGDVDKTGVNNPCVPGLTGHNTGALPGPTSTAP